jgi:galactokinase
MVYVANLFDKGVLSDVDPSEFRAKGWSASDRPVRRAMHFFDENERVPLMRDALRKGDGNTYMRLMNESGRSSENLLNNIVTSASGDRKLAEGLEKSAELLEGKGAWRVHGGGFAGCVQALMPADYFPVYKEEMEKQFGKDSCRELKLV